MSNSKSVSRTQRRKKFFAIEQFGGKCQICGYDKCYAALEFHHIDARTKKHAPSYIIMRWSWTRAVEELKKCMLVCSNCHKEIHFGRYKEDELWRKTPEWQSKKCLVCKQVFETKSSEQRNLCTNCATISFRKTKRPDADTLRLEVASFNWCALGRKYGVSDNAVRKWARQYGII